MKSCCHVLLAALASFALARSLAGAAYQAEAPADAQPAAVEEPAVPAPLVPPAPAPRETGTPLLTAEFPGEKWTHYSAKMGAPLEETWSLRPDPESETGELLLVCLGEPHGYLRTRTEYKNFRLSLEWRYPSEGNGHNSGVLLFASGEDKIWPACIQVQLLQAELGETFPIGGAKSENELRNLATRTPPLANPLKKWNQAVIVCRDGTVEVTINEQAVGKIVGSLPAAGAIGLQSEGSEIHFRRIRLQELPAMPATELVTPNAPPAGEPAPVDTGVRLPPAAQRPLSVSK